MSYTNLGRGPARRRTPDVPQEAAQNQEQIDNLELLNVPQIADPWEEEVISQQFRTTLFGTGPTDSATGSSNLNPLAQEFVPQQQPPQYQAWVMTPEPKKNRWEAFDNQVSLSEPHGARFPLPPAPGWDTEPIGHRADTYPPNVTLLGQHLPSLQYDNFLDEIGYNERLYPFGRAEGMDISLRVPERISIPIPDPPLPGEPDTDEPDADESEAKDGSEDEPWWYEFLREYNRPNDPSVPFDEQLPPLPLPYRGLGGPIEPGMQLGQQQLGEFDLAQQHFVSPFAPRPPPQLPYQGLGGPTPYQGLGGLTPYQGFEGLTPYQGLGAPMPYQGLEGQMPYQELGAPIPHQQRQPFLWFNTALNPPEEMEHYGGGLRPVMFLRELTDYIIRRFTDPVNGQTSYLLFALTSTRDPTPSHPNPLPARCSTHGYYIEAYAVFALLSGKRDHANSLWVLLGELIFTFKHGRDYGSPRVGILKNPEEAAFDAAVSNQDQRIKDKVKYIRNTLASNLPDLDVVQDFARTIPYLLKRQFCNQTAKTSDRFKEKKKFFGAY